MQVGDGVLCIHFHPKNVMLAMLRNVALVYLQTCAFRTCCRLSQMRDKLVHKREI